MSLSARMSDRRLPIIDFKGYEFGDLAERRRIAQAIVAASSDFGFFYLEGHGVSLQAQRSGFEAAQEFFAMPIAQRMACKAGSTGQNRGYQPLFDTAREGEAPDVKESFDMGFPLPAGDPDQLSGKPFHGANSWPEAAGIRIRVERLYDAMLQCGRQVLRCMALGLGADENFFVGHASKPITNMRLVHYPPQPAEVDAGIGARAHVDKGLITLLLNDEHGGLHVQTAQGDWIDAPPRAGAMIINVGQLLTRWTNGRFVSAVHRVVNSGGTERYSIPQFHHCDYDAVIDPQTLFPNEPPAFDAVVAGDFVAAGFKRDRRSWRAE